MDPVEDAATPPSPPVEGDDPAFVNVSDWVAQHARLRPETLALVQPGQQRRALTWAELEFRVAAVAAGLAASWLIAGHRVGLRSPNSIEFVVAYFAILRAGLVAVPMDPHASDDEARFTLAHSGSRLLLSSAEVRFDAVATLPLTESGLADLAAAAAGSVISPADGEALAVLLYTAGTSGDAKAVMLTHRALLSHQEHLARLQMFDARTVVLALLPLFHVFGLNAVLGSWARAGGTAVIMDGFPDNLGAVLVAEQVDNLPVAPALLYRLLQLQEQATAWAGVSMVVSGAAPLPEDLSRRFTERTGLRIEQGYGLTEAAPGVATTIGGDILGPGHVGRALPGVDVRIGDGRDEGEPGEIWVRGDNLFSGYWPDGRGGPDAEGWFATGDIGYQAAGQLFLVDRARELIVVNGFNVYPAEVEAAIRELAGVADAAVLGRARATGSGTGEDVVAFVAGIGLSPEVIIEHCATTLARFKRPTAVYLLNELPRGATGKVKKGALRRLMATPDGAAENHV